MFFTVCALLTSCEMSEKRLSQKPLTVEDVEKSVLALLEEHHEMHISQSFPKEREPLFSTPSTVRGSFDKRFSPISPHYRLFLRE